MTSNSKPADKFRFISLSIIIVNYGKRSYSYLENCLKSIYEASVPEKFSFEIIVIDNASTSDAVADLNKKFPTANFKMFAENMGYARAVNVGIGIASGKYILILNNDIVFKKNTLSAMKKFLDSKPIFAIAGLQLFYSDGSIQFSKGKYPSIHGIFIGLFKSRYIKKWDTRNYDVQSETQWVSGAAMLLHDPVGKNLQFDENYFMYYEDVDICFRAKKNGHKVLYLPSVKAYHRNPFHVQKSVEKDLYYEIRKSQLYFFRKNYGMLSYVALKILTLLYVTLIVVLSGMFFFKYTSVFKVYIYVLKKLLTNNKYDENSAG